MTNIYDILRRIPDLSADQHELIDNLEASAALGTVASRELEPTHVHEPQIIKQYINADTRWRGGNYRPDSQERFNIIKVCKLCQEVIP
jgi:hypothetical protein